MFMPSGVVIRRKHIAITVKGRRRFRPWKDLVFVYIMNMNERVQYK